MSVKKSDIWAMIHTTDKVLTDNNSIWSADVVFAAAVLAMRQGIDTSTATQQAIAELLSQHTAVQKTKTLAKLEVKFMFAVKRLQSFAKVTGNDDLLTTMQYTTSTFEDERDDAILTDTQVIIAAAQKYLSQLEPYAVTQTTVDDLIAISEDYSVICSVPHANIMQMKALNIQFRQSQSDTLDVFDSRLDLDIEVYKTSNTSFYNQYKQSRVIVFDSSIPCSILANISSQATGDAMSAVNCVFTLMGQTTPAISKITTDKGNFRIQYLAEGKYTVTISKIGFKTQTITIIVTDDETTQLTIIMEKE